MTQKLYNIPEGKPPLTPCGHNNYGCKHGCVLIDEENDIHSLKYKTPHCPLPSSKIKCDCGYSQIRQTPSGKRYCAHCGWDCGYKGIDIPTQAEDAENEQDEVCSLIAQKLGHVCGSVNIAKAEKEAREILCLYSKKEVDGAKTQRCIVCKKMPATCCPICFNYEKQQAVEKALGPEFVEGLAEWHANYVFDKSACGKSSIRYKDIEESAKNQWRGLVREAIKAARYPNLKKGEEK